MTVESIQQKLLRVRPPRVRITYDVETGGSSEKVELAFIVGMFANLSGDLDSSALPLMKDRRMREIDAESFDKILADSSPTVRLNGIPDTIRGGNAVLTGNLTFTCLADFEPLAVVRAVPSLNKRYDARADLRALQSMAECNDALGAALDMCTRDAAAMTAIKTSFPAGEPDSWVALDVNPMATMPDVPTGADAPALIVTLLATQMKANTELALAAKQADDDAAAASTKAATAVTDATTARDAAQTAATKAATDYDTAEAAAKAATGDKAIADANATLVTALKARDDTAKALADAKAAADTATDTAARLAAVAADRHQAFLAIDPLSKARRLAGRYANEIIVPVGNKELQLVGLGANGLIDERAVAVDLQIGVQLDGILHSKSFQSLEATWRGLFYVVSRSETGRLLKLRVFNASMDDLRKELEKAVEFDQSGVFKMIYEAEFGTYGGSPYSLLVGGYEFDHSPNHMSLLNNLTKVAASAHAPFIAAAAPGLFGLDSFDKLARPRDLGQLFESPEMAEWVEFRNSEDSRYVALALPHVLLRLPYGKDSRPAEGLHYEETVNNDDGPDHDAFLWGNAAWALAERITHAFALYHWTAAIRGVEGGGMVDGLPVYTYRDSADLVNMICPTEVSITDRREKELNDLGFIALCNCKGTGQAAFFGGQTTNLPRQYISDEANANAKLSAMLPYILAASRFAHYIKVIMRKKIGAFLTRGNIEAYLNSWISQYVLLDDNASQEVKASYPLRAAQVTVTEVPGSPGSYKATVFIKPHFQLEELTTSIRLVADLPAG
ncbi:type VI secretion system protein ImpC [Luteibacter sp. Sphag1AF]|uniref:type VI secretion system contractile sheath large subunit n=1 Tax=Luteibacter sp. Sphag1AF TaxID=2587031 RepID=UPI00160E2240|nr:type VI secretion system contractile sheath large subunit [Luteibacter sp. Sphag1AF]MBB3228063.1 type VI secretion system protein ImpC [Luteibacter sp. Sphag1AF]